MPGFPDKAMPGFPDKAMPLERDQAMPLVESCHIRKKQSYMAYKRKDTMVLRQLVMLYVDGKSNREISRQLGINRNTVNKYVSALRALCRTKEELLRLPESDLGSLFAKPEPDRPDRYKRLIDYFLLVLRSSNRVGFTYQKMWQRYRKEHTDGYSYSQFMDYYHRWHTEKVGPEVSLKLHHKAGEHMMVDYTGKKLSWEDRGMGEVKQVEVFLSCLPASNLVYVQATPSQQKDDFISCLINCLNYFGGVPKASITDNL